MNVDQIMEVPISILSTSEVCELTEALEGYKDITISSVTYIGGIYYHENAKLTYYDVVEMIEDFRGISKVLIILNIKVMEVLSQAAIVEAFQRVWVSIAKSDPKTWQLHLALVVS